MTCACPFANQWIVQQDIGFFVLVGAPTTSPPPTPTTALSLIQRVEGGKEFFFLDTFKLSSLLVILQNLLNPDWRWPQWIAWDVWTQARVLAFHSSCSLFSLFLGFSCVMFCIPFAIPGISPCIPRGIHDPVNLCSARYSRPSNLVYPGVFMTR